MATSPTTLFPTIEEKAPVAALARARSNHRRRITPEAGRAMERLGHAIDYLVDEYIHEGGEFRSNDAKLQAVEMLMAINREIYLACPELPTLGERCHAWLHGLKH
jgi:hypothetical protein